MTAPVTIDGSSGGGQMLRNAVALSAVTGRPVRVENIRSARPRPGLRPQHLAGVRAVAAVSGASLTGAEIGSRTVEFRPGRRSTETRWRFDVGTAGSVLLVLQSLLPALACGPTPSTLTLTGGTDVPFSPPFDYFAQVFAPALARLGPRLDVHLSQRGFYPKGGGEIEVAIRPAPAIGSFAWTERAPVTAIRGLCYSQRLPEHIVPRLRDAAVEALLAAGQASVDVETEIVDTGPSEGCGLVLWADCGEGRLGAAALGRRGVPAERVGREAVDRLLREIDSGAAVDEHLGDQLVVWMAMAEDPSEVTVAAITDHIRCAAEVAEAVAGARFTLEEGPPARVKCEPGTR